MPSRYFAALAMLLGLAPGLFGQAPDPVRRLQERFIAPCCWAESVAVHRSEIAARMRTEIERMWREGQSEDQIVSLYVAQFGERVLLEPRGQRSVWLIVVPFAALAAGAAFLVLYLMRVREARPAEVTPERGSGPPPPRFD